MKDKISYLPKLTREGWPDFDMESADSDIQDILNELGDFVRGDEQMEENVGALAGILGGLMAYCSAFHKDLMIYRRALH